MLSSIRRGHSQALEGKPFLPVSSTKCRYPCKAERQPLLINVLPFSRNCKKRWQWLTKGQ
jgi:hypothetical protein